MTDIERDAKIVREAVDFATICPGYFKDAQAALDRLVTLASATEEDEETL